MIIKQADTPRFKRILLELNALVFGKTPALRSNTVTVDQGDYEDEIAEFLREDSISPPTEPTTANDAEKLSLSSTESNTAADLNEAPLSPHLNQHVETLTTLQESRTVSTSSKTISITTHPSEPEADIDAPITQPKKSRPAPRKKTIATNSVDASDVTPIPTTRGTRASTRRAAPLPKQDSQPTVRGSGRKRAKDA